MNSDDLSRLLEQDFSDLPEDDLREDLQIIQPDGSRACIAYELSGKGYSLVDFEN